MLERLDQALAEAEAARERARAAEEERDREERERTRLRRENADLAMQVQALLLGVRPGGGPSSSPPDGSSAASASSNVVVELGSVAELQERNQRLLRERQTLRETVSELEARLELDPLRARARKAEEELAELREEREGQDAPLPDQRGEAENEEELAVLQSDLAEARSARSGLEERLARLDAHALHLSGSVDALRSQLSASHADRAKSDAEAQYQRERAGRVEGALERARAKASRGAKARRELQSVNAELQKALKGARADWALLESVHRMERSLSAKRNEEKRQLEEDLKEKTAALGAERKKRAAEAEELRELIADVELRAKEAEDRKNEVLRNMVHAKEGEQEKAISDLKSKASDLESQLQSSRQDAQAACTRIESLTEAIKGYQAEATAAQNNYKQEVALHATAQTDLRTARAEKETEMRLRQTAESQLRMLRLDITGEREAWEQAKAKLEESLEVAETRLKGAQEQNKVLHSQMATLTETVKKLQSERIASLNQIDPEEHARALSRADAAKKELDSLKALKEKALWEQQANLMTAKSVSNAMTKERDQLKECVKSKEAELAIAKGDFAALIHRMGAENKRLQKEKKIAASKQREAEDALAMLQEASKEQQMAATKAQKQGEVVNPVAEPPTAASKPVEKPQQEEPLASPAKELYRSFVDAEKPVISREPVFLLFDVETTGLNAKTCYIIQLAAKVLGDDEVFSEYILPPVPVSKKIEELTGITDTFLRHGGVDAVTGEQYAGPAGNFSQAYHHFCEFVSRKAQQQKVCLVAHNAAFDLRFLSAEIKRLAESMRLNGNFGMDIPDLKSVGITTSLDTLKLLRTKKLWLPPSFKLAKIYHHVYQKDMVASHNAVGDVSAIEDILLSPRLQGWKVLASQMQTQIISLPLGGCKFAPSVHKSAAPVTIGMNSTDVPPVTTAQPTKVVATTKGAVTGKETEEDTEPAAKKIKNSKADVHTVGKRRKPLSSLISIIQAGQPQGSENTRKGHQC